MSSRPADETPGWLRRNLDRSAGDAAPRAGDHIDAEAERALRMFGAPPPDRPFTPLAARFAMPRAGKSGAEREAQLRREKARAPFTVFLPGIIIGAALGYVAMMDDPSQLQTLPDKIMATLHEPKFYINCGQVRAVGAAPLRRGDPGYSRWLDTDGDGVACEPFFGDAAAKKPGKHRHK